MVESKQNLPSSKSSLNLRPMKSALLAGSRTNLKSKSRIKFKNSRGSLTADTVLTANDTNDPSYTNLVLPYRVICRHRYYKAGVLQRQQFIKEIQAHELIRDKALDGVRIHRIFCNTILRPLHVSEQVKISQQEQMKIEEILKMTLKL